MNIPVHVLIMFISTIYGHMYLTYRMSIHSTYSLLKFCWGLWKSSFGVQILVVCTDILLHCYKLFNHSIFSENVENQDVPGNNILEDNSQKQGTKQICVLWNRRQVSNLRK